jgi:KipI family sensor histidine kinase inhibitor
VIAMPRLDPDAPAPAISAIGTKALLFEAPGEFSMAAQRRIWSLMKVCEERADIAETVPGVTNILLVFKEAPRRIETIMDWLLGLWPTLPELEIEGRLFEIGVHYGGTLGEDLHRVADYAGLSPREVIERHQAAEYTVCTIASAPGFAYLHGLDPAIAMPRKTVPSLRMLAGTVTIGGPQAGISALTGPNGWNSIGYTDVKVFDPGNRPPALFALADRIRFHAERIEL